MLTGRQHGTLGLVGVGLFVVAVVALHILDPGLSPLNEYMSVYGRGEFGWLLRGASISLGLGTIAIALGLRDTLASGKRVTASWVLIMIAGLGFLVAGLFVTDPTGAYAAGRATISGAIHDLAGYASLLSFLVSSWMLRGVFARDSRHEHLARAQWWFAVLLTVALLLLFALSPRGLVGLAQRIYFVVLVTWLFVLAANIRHVDRSTGASV